MNEPATASPPISPNWKRQAVAVLLIIGSLAYAWLLWRHVSPHAGGSDPSGYFNSAKLFSHGRFFAPARVPAGHHAADFGDYATVPLGFIPRADDRLAPSYPTGYPLHLVVASVFGWKRAAPIANVLLAVASGLLLYAYARRLGLGRGLALGGVALLWCCPLFLYAALIPMSDLPALTWTMAALYCSLEARNSWRWGLLCGLAVGVAVLVRPTNLLVALPVAAAIGLRPRAWLAVGLGGLPAAAFLLFYNWRVYGSPFLTGYNAVFSSFSAEFFPHNLAHFAHWIPALLSPLVLLAIASPFVAAARQRGFVVMVLWAATLVGFYVFYYHSGETWWYLRFILPAFPALILGGLVVLDAVARAASSRARWAATAFVALLVFATGWQMRQIRELDILNIELGERTYPEAARWARQNLPADSALFCMQVSGAFFYYTDFLMLRWDMIQEDRMARLFTALEEAHRPVYAILYDFEQPRAMELMGRQWRQIHVVGNATFWQPVPPPARP